MEKEIYSLIDTTLKIGLGALISGLSAYVLSSSKYKQDAKKEKRDLTIKMLTETSLKIEEARHKFHEANHPFWEQVVEGNIEGTESSVKNCLSILLASNALLHEVKAFVSLLDIPECISLIDEVHEKLDRLYMQTASKNPFESADELNTIIGSIDDGLSKCLVSLSKEYKNA